MREFLQYVRRPGRYIGPEPNAIVKPHDSVKIKVVLVYPDLYEIGVSNLGLKILYELINGLPYALAERAYSPGIDMQAVMEKYHARLTTIESDTPLDAFDVIGITLQTELNYANALNIIKLAGLPLRANERERKFPIIVGGGSCTYNPEPLADFFDAFVIGDGEAVIKDMLDTLILCKERNVSKYDCLKSLAQIRGIYIPCFYKQEEDTSGNFKGVIPVNNSIPPVVTKAIISDINSVSLKHTIIPFIKPVHDRLVVEIARGCTKGCRFCQAGIIYRPVREKNVDTILEEIKYNMKTSGFYDVSLLSLSAADYSHILPLLKLFVYEFKDDRCSISLPSLRVDSVTGSILDQIKQVRKTGFTLAIEAGTQRLRNIINKNITDEQIISSVELAARLGWQTIKLYFMLGLPFETEDDVKGMADLISRIYSTVRKYNKKTQINASISAFIPKPHTPFQWSEMITSEVFKAKLSVIKKLIKNTGVVIKYQLPEISLIEAILARGDRRLGHVIEDVVKYGINYDSSETGFNHGVWFKVLKERGFSLSELLRQRDVEEPLPWDHINTFVPKTFLFQEFKKAAEGVLTPDCFTQVCYDCGVCDFKSVEPIHAKNDLPDIFVKQPDIADPNKQYNWTTTVRVQYTKLGLIRFLGHLELVDFLMHLLHKAALPLVYTRGFHPKPVASFSDPLPVGIESYSEYLDIKLYGEIDTDVIKKKLKEVEYDGLTFVDVVCLPYGSEAVSNATKAVYYEMSLDSVNSCNISVLDSAINLLLNSEKFMIVSSNNNKEIDVRAFIDTIKIEEGGRLIIVLKKLNNRIVGPIDIIEKGLGIPYNDIINAPLKKVRVDFKDE